MTVESLVLKTCIEGYQQVQALKDGRVAIPGVSFDFVDVHPITRAFKPMAERLEFDVSEMALTTYLVARSFNRAITALPVVVSRGFHHGSVVYREGAGIREPRDIEGKKVGLRAYAQTTPVWVRGILHSEYGVNLEKVTWVTFEGSHVSDYRDPDNCVRAPEGKTIESMLQAGELDGAIGGGRGLPGIKPLIPEPRKAEEAWFQKTGLYPINHLVVVKSALAAAHPWLLGELFKAFKKAKELHLAHLKEQVATGDPGWPRDPERPWIMTNEEQLRLQRIVGGDHLPYGVKANRKEFEACARFAFEQKLLPRPYAIEELFEPSVLEME